MTKEDKMKKKGIMLEFLVTVILAIIIFAPSCLFASKFFRLSDQAKQNYNDFAHDISDLAKNGKAGEKKSVLLILDAETGLFYFEKPELKITVDATEESFQDYTIQVARPTLCQGSCLCLFRKVQTKYNLVTGILVITPASVLCQEVSDLDYPANCGFGEPLKVNSYSCDGGFMLDRLMKTVPKGKVTFNSYYNNFRRQDLVLEKKKDTVYVSKPGAP